MFNDRFSLTDLVLSGQKTQTRRIEKSLLSLQTKEIKGQCYKFYDNKFREVTDDLRYLDTAAPDRYAVIVRTTDGQLLEFKPQYRMGEVVAVAQSYQKAGIVFAPIRENALINKRGEKWGNARKSAGWENKIFVKPDLMPHAIKITNIRVERLQDISDEDCLAEGVKEVEVSNNWGNSATHTEYSITYYNKKSLSKQLVSRECPQEAFAALIDKINGYGTWASNPYVFVYDFELVK